LGLVTPAGLGIDANVSRVWSGQSTASASEQLADLPVKFSCRVDDVDITGYLGRRLSLRLDRVSQLAIIAAREAIADADLDPREWDSTRVGVVMGTSLGAWNSVERAHEIFRSEGPDMVSPVLMTMAPASMMAGHISIDCRALGPSQVICTGCASSNSAIGYARAMLAAGECDIAIVGGSEAAMTPTAMAGLFKAGALSTRNDDPASASRPFDVDRDGFVAGEGAAVLILERVTYAVARGARVRARIQGYGSSADGFHVSAPDPNGAGAERAVRAALANADLCPSDIQHVSAHGTSTPLNDRIESAMIRRVFPDGPAVCSTKGVIGHLMGAAGAVDAIYTVLAIERGSVPPTANLVSVDPDVEIDVVAKEARPLQVRAAVSTAFGFGGQNTAIVIVSA
jgi:3-oxoacyl-[acyl-carrier-protein] synthase II